MKSVFCRWSHYIWGSAARVFLFSVFWGLWSHQISAHLSIVPIPKTPAVGENVLLSVSFTGTALSFTWHRGETVSDNNRIITFFPSALPFHKTFFPYEGRVTGFPNGSMEISKVKISDSGSYTLHATLTRQQATVNITIYEILDKPSVTTSFPHPMEHKDSVTLTCVTSSTTETILWFKDNQIFPSNDRISLSQDNRTLTIFRVSSTDSGSYQCEVMNPVSRNTSDPYTLTVNPSPAGGPDTSLQTAVGAAIGSVLGAAVLITSAVLLYKRGSNCWTGKYGVTEEYEVPKVSSTPPALNQNITQQNLGGTYVNTLNPRAPAPAYTDLLFRNQSVYNDLKR